MESNVAQLEEVLVRVWTQAMCDKAGAVKLGSVSYPARKTRSGLLQVDFAFEGRELRGLEQNPKTKSRWAGLARSGKRIMQFFEAGRYVANVNEGKITVYGHSRHRK